MHSIDYPLNEEHVFSYPELLERVECFDRKVCQQVVEEAERAEAIIDSHKDQWVQPLDDVPLKVEGCQRVQPVQGTHGNLPEVVLSEIEECQALKVSQSSRGHLLEEAAFEVEVLETGLETPEAVGGQGEVGVVGQLQGFEPQCYEGVVRHVFDLVSGKVELTQQPQLPQGFHWHRPQRVSCQVKGLESVLEAPEGIATHTRCSSSRHLQKSYQMMKAFHVLLLRCKQY